MNYQEMSDFEIRRKVGDVLKVNWVQGLHFSFKGGLREFDPCNSWADAGPIIQESKIGIREYDGWWEARSYIPEYAYCQKNPLRAAMIVFLMMKGGE
ncbi:phage protein NinX family protein [Rosenbergiella epipactidis]|uniref:phage protein NinX family protein n=1 Tax=Rosenbergiella epipactidis TaxID=1544694 RepID=UPI001F4E2A1A|nr:phage protein NinX family protein [Rosenbergiella epipactidis]